MKEGKYVRYPTATVIEFSVGDMNSEDLSVLSSLAVIH